MPDPFEASGFFVARSPLLPLDVLSEWGAPLGAPRVAGTREELATALAADRARLRASLRALVERPDVREAIFVASPGFESRLTAWLEDPTSERGSRLEPALVRYVERAAGRPTPFGLFAGHSLGTFGRETSLGLPARDGYTRRTRIDQRVLFRVTEALADDAELRADVRFVPAPTLYPAGRALRYIEVQHDVERGDTEHRVASVVRTKHLDRVLACARGGAVPVELARALVGADVSLEEAGQYVAALIEARILVPMIEPTLTTSDPARALLNDLAEIPPARHTRALLSRACDAFAALDAAGVGAAPARYRELATELEALGVLPDGSSFVHVNLVKPAPGLTIGPALARQLARAVELVARVGVPSPANDSLVRFRESFVARFEAREVPLLEALDDDVGVGFERGASPEDAAPVLAGLKLGKEAQSARSWSARSDYLLRRVHEVLAGAATVWHLEPRDLEALSTASRLPNAFALHAALERDPSAPGEDRTLRVHALALWAQSGAGALARLGAVDGALRSHLEAHLEKEEALTPDAIVAEIVHVPSSAEANNLQRPALRRWEIACMARSGADADNVLPLSDLGVSIVGDQIVLRSRKHRRRVLPRNTTAHNVRVADSTAYRFLGALAIDSAGASIGWDWGPLVGAPFLPRVVCGDVVLMPARWRLFADEIRTLREARSDVDRFLATRALREKRRLPRNAAYAVSDHVLRIDFENPLSLDAFLDAVKTEPHAGVVEVMSDPHASPFRSPEGSFAHEIFVPYVRTKVDRPATDIARPDREREAVPRILLPGSEWLSTRIHLAATTFDELLADLVGPLVKLARESRAIDGWFFVPIASDEPHLRLRLHGAAGALHAGVLPELQEAVAKCVGDGRVARFEIDTYQREIERYGGPEGIALAERQFTIDSDAALELLRASASAGEAHGRYRLVLLAHDAFLDDLGFDLETKLTVARRFRDGYRREMSVTTEQERQIGQRFRDERTSLESILAREPTSPLAFASRILERRSTALTTWAREVREAEARGGLDVPIHTIAPSWLHMSAGRLVPAMLRQQELVVFEMLVRLYEAACMRRRASGA
ncbi:MAG: lantibiotic dehydratase [Polyangiaceae bacterium]